MIHEFDEIRPYLDEELPQIYEELINDEAFRYTISTVIPIPFDKIAQQMRGCKTKLEFQKTFCLGFLKRIARDATDGLTIDLDQIKDRGAAYTYISNHRDIILDSGFLSVLLFESGMDSVEVAIGDNLLIFPWIKKLVRINKSFIVQRALTMRQMLESSMRMSRYMHYTIRDKNQSIWIAQREGRAKDSDDRTQDSVLKMLAMGGSKNVLESIREMNIVPLAISYEYDPCDFLKAKEFQLKRDNPKYKKEQKDDLRNMETGLFGRKGRVMFRPGRPLNELLKDIPEDISKNELFPRISALIDESIHSNYTIYENNYVAQDLLEGTDMFSAHYTDYDVMSFKKYIDAQIARIDIENKDVEFLRRKLLEMYANPLKNYLKATGK